MMENFSYENQGTNTYLKFVFPKNATPDRLALGMISNNNIDGFWLLFMAVQMVFHS